MRCFRFFILSLLLLTVPSLFLYSQAALPPFVTHPHDFQSYSSYDEVVEFLEEIENGELENKYSEEDLSKIIDFCIFLARLGILPNEIAQQKPYIIQMRGGKAIDKYGNMIDKKDIKISKLQILSTKF